MKTNKLTYYAVMLSMAGACQITLAEKIGGGVPNGLPKTVQPETPTVNANEKLLEKSATETVKPAVMEPGTLTATISDSVTFSTLKKALAASGLDVTLADKKGVYTIFAPTDEAFDKLPAGTLGKLMLPQNKEKLRSLLLFHVIPGKMLAADLKNGEVTTANAEKVKIKVDGETIKVGDAKIFSANVMASNGVMHSIGEVLVPKSLEGFSGLKD